LRSEVRQVALLGVGELQRLVEFVGTRRGAKSAIYDCQAGSHRVVTSVEEGGYVFGLFVCLSVGLLANL